MEDLRKQIDEFISKNGISRNVFAKNIDINPSYLAGYMKEGKSFKYSDKVEALAKKYLDNYTPRKEISQDELPFIATKDAKAINAVISWVAQDRDMGVVIGEAGTGKSRAVKEYASNHPEVVLIEATISTSARVLFKILSDKFNVGASKSIDETIRAVANELKKVQKMIIIDEAEHLPYRALEGIRRMYDFSGSPVVLVGTKKLLMNLTGGKKNNLEYEQLSSRIGSKWNLEGLVNAKGDKDLVEVCKHFGVVDKNDVDLVKSLTRGNFRKTEKLLKRALRIAVLNECEINDECIKEATKMLL
ncbi:bacteriophage DNA transposition protein B [Campylobacter blaseri]|uniref:Bacteriocin n=1 Tax=Campylobacter blaseri TaxID=2042961 RepID=A0A2P8R2M5_9BACT|nr:AAA family ATPase [Campylobacter blaseri]PSM52766.1 bacteriocin [Campylobacter blaseri]PSM54414.1 bacteriocin [Campylobacter blaseri]QKF86077.1 bacteriophage DNA transposition protein B [Campylobacter blaseri]